MIQDISTKYTPRHEENETYVRIVVAKEFRSSLEYQGRTKHDCADGQIDIAHRLRRKKINIGKC
jgi:hypothetical protein